MTTPTRTEIEQYARAQWHQDRVRRGDPSFNIEPEIEEFTLQFELKEFLGKKYEDFKVVFAGMKISV